MHHENGTNYSKVFCSGKESFFHFKNILKLFFVTNYKLFLLVYINYTEERRSKFYQNRVSPKNLL